MSTIPINAFLLISTAIYLGAALAFLVGLRRRKRRADAHAFPFVSVVIAARNEAGYIGDCLKGLAGQSYPADRYEVLVVDDGSTDGTAQIVRVMPSNIHTSNALKSPTPFGTWPQRNGPFPKASGRRAGPSF